MATLTGPEVGDPAEAQVWALEWERPDADGMPNFWRLTQVEDPAGHTVEYVYDFDADGDGTVDDVTLVTGIVEMDPDGTGSGTESTTTIDYYWSDHPNANGQLKTVTDANDVEHKYTYDDWGYFAAFEEGAAGQSPGYPVGMSATNDAVGRAIAGDGDAGGGSNDYDDNNNLTDSICEVPISACAELPLRLGKVPSPCIDAMITCSGGNQYDALDRPTELYGCISALLPNSRSRSNSRTHEYQWDALGRLTRHDVTSDEQNTSGSATFTRTTEYTSYDPDGRVLTREGPDGQETTYTYDDVGRLETLTRGDMSAEYHYDAASRVDYVDYGNGTQVDYEYDDANRVLSIEHIGPGPATLYMTVYEWNPNNTIAARTETDNSSGSTVETVVSFEYDARDRLIRETRVRQGSPDVTEYEIAYTYDGLGNRLSKTQTTATEGDPLTVETVYSYDVDGTEAFETHNNRLLEYNEYVDEELTRTMSYVYYKTGHASNVTIKDAGDEVYRGLALYYTRTGRLWLAIWEQWELDEYEEVTNYAATAAREFMYDSGRARYLARDVDPETFEPEGTQRWTDYAGGPFDAAAGAADEPYGDFAVTIGQQGAAVIDESMRYLNAGDGAGGVVSRQTVVERQGDELDYLHGDLIRSTVATTDADGTNHVYVGPPVTVAYTAFGELVTRDGSGNVTIGSAAPAGFPRYQYAGGFGYESGSADASDTSGMLTLNGAEGTSPIRLMHVGERWYQPDIGRFVMRDPIGWQGGANLYSYVEVEPIIRVDPKGLNWIDDLFRLATLIDERQILHSLAVQQGDLSAAARYAKQLARLRNLIPRWWLPLMPVCAAYIGAEAGDAFDDYLKSLGGQPWGGPPTAGHWRQFLTGTGYD